MKISIEGDLDFGPGGFEGEIDKARKEDIRNSLRSVICPTHKKKAKLTFRKKGKELEVSVDCCCQELERIVNKKMIKN